MIETLRPALRAGTATASSYYIVLIDFKISVGNTLNVFAIDEALRISRLKWPPLVL